MQVALTKDGVTKWFGVHRLVLSAFVGEPSPGLVCNHKDSCPTNNKLENLEWVTPAENMQHSFNSGRREHSYKRGEDNARAKLTNAEVRKIRDEYRPGVVGCGAHALAKKYGVSKTAMRMILAGKTYRNV
jgi:hypothetical protein